MGASSLCFLGVILASAGHWAHSIVTGLGDRHFVRVSSAMGPEDRNRLRCAKDCAMQATCTGFVVGDPCELIVGLDAQAQCTAFAPELCYWRSGSMPTEGTKVELMTTEVTTEVPAEATSEVPAEVTTEVPAEVTSEVPAEVTTEVPAEVTSEVPAEVTTEVTTEVPAEVTTEVPAEVTTEVTTEVPAEVTTEVPAEVTTEVTTEVPAEVTTEVTTEVPAEVTSEVPAEVTTEVTAEVTSEVPAEVTTELPAEVTTEVPPELTTAIPQASCEVGIPGSRSVFERDTVYVMYPQSDHIDGFNQADSVDTFASNIINRVTVEQHAMSTYNPGVAANMADVYYIVLGFHMHAYILYDDGTLEVMKYGWNAWSMVSTSPKTLAAEYGVAPSIASAAAHDEANKRVYLVEAPNTVYPYDVTGSSPDTAAYVPLPTFEFTVNGVSNPFSAGPGSPLSQPPSAPHALYIGPADDALAFCGDSLYAYNRRTQAWRFAGKYTCP